MARVALFSAHSPLTGGGGVILRSLVPELVDHSVVWHYTNSKEIEMAGTAHLGAGVLGGSFLSDVLKCWLLLSCKKLTRINQIVDQLLQVDCDCYWIVSHNEGLRVAYELKRRQSSRKVHLTVHDDWPAALCGRSWRYRWFARWAERLTMLTVRSVDTFDVISTGMRDRYKENYLETGFVCHRYLTKDSITPLDLEVLKCEYETGVVVGHIGSVYDANDLWTMAKVLKSYGANTGQSVKLRLWGCHLKPHQVPEGLQDIFDFRPPLPEDEIIPMLKLCDCVYASYSMAMPMRVFSQTSLPTKLTTYVQAGRPIIGHGPSKSSLAEFLEKTDLGLMWTNRSVGDGERVFCAVLKLEVPHHSFEVAREIYFGDRNVEAMSAVFESEI